MDIKLTVRDGETLGLSSLLSMLSKEEMDKVEAECEYLVRKPIEFGNPTMDRWGSTTEIPGHPGIYWLSEDGPRARDENSRKHLMGSLLSINGGDLENIQISKTGESFWQKRYHITIK